MYIYRLWLMKRNLKQWWSTVPSIPTKRTTIAHLELKLLRQNKKHDMMLVTVALTTKDYNIIVILLYLFLTWYKCFVILFLILLL
jgi:hypothetical protein